MGTTRRADVQPLAAVYSFSKRCGLFSGVALRFQKYSCRRACSIRDSAVESKVIQVKVKPNSRVSSFEQAEGGTWLARLRSPPVDGKANEELIALLAKHFGCRKADVSIKSGASGRMKLVRIETE